MCANVRSSRPPAAWGRVRIARHYFFRGSDNYYSFLHPCAHIAEQREASATQTFLRFVGDIYMFVLFLSQREEEQRSKGTLKGGLDVFGNERLDARVLYIIR